MPTIRLNITGDTPSSVQLTVLTRSDTGMTPLGFTLPINFTLANGIWSFSQPDLVPPPTSYSYTYRLNWPDGTFTTQSGSIEGGRYYSQAGIQNIYGVANVAKWSNKEGDSTTADATAIAAAGQDADDLIDSKARRAGFAVPIASTSADFSRIQNIANEIAGVKLYQGRGEAPNTDSPNIAGQMQAHLDAAMRELDELIYPAPGTAALDCPRASGWSNAPVAVAATVDPSGMPVGVSPFGRWTWDGFQYRWTT